MKKITIILSIIFFFSFISEATSVPLLTDEIPQDYINKVRKTPSQKTYVQEMSSYDKETAIPVKVYSPVHIRFKFKRRVENYHYYMDVTNIKRNDTFTLLVYEDVYKDGKLFIKKDTQAVGIVQNANICIDGEGAPSEFRLSNFRTKDINNNNINLYGHVLNDYSGVIQLASHALNKNKVYTLYYK